MAKRYGSADNPTFDSYPANPDPSETAAGGSQVNRDALPKVDESPGEKDPVVHRAEQIGTAIGKTVAAARSTAASINDTAAEARRKFEVIRSKPGDIREKAKQRLGDVQQLARERFADFRLEAEHKARELRGMAEARFGELREQASEKLQQAQEQARERVRQVDAAAKRDPLKTVLIAGAVGLVLGVVLQLWRSSDEW